MQDKLYIRNRKATFDYKVEQTFIAGIALIGQEVKSIKQKRVDFNESYITVTKKMEAILHGLNISQYKSANTTFLLNNDPKRPRKLLLKKREIAKMHSLTAKTNWTIVPLSLFYNSRHLVKLEIAVVSPLKKYDKRAKLKAKDLERQSRRDDVGS